MHVAGVSPLDSWEYTWGEGIEVVNAYTVRENERSKRQAVALYNAAAFLTKSLKVLFNGGEMQGFTEAFPGFTSELENEKQEDMSDDAMYAVVRMLNAQFGGKEEI